MVLMRAASFPAMHIVKSPGYMREDISTDRGRNAAMEQINKIIDAMVTDSSTGTEPEAELTAL